MDKLGWIRIWENGLTTLKNIIFFPIRSPYMVSSAVILGFLVYALLSMGEDYVPPPPEQPKKPQQALTSPPPAPAPTGPVKEEDGNSKFSTDLFAKMNDNELGFYGGTLSWVMQNQPDGELFQRNYGRIKLQIKPKDRFKNGLGHDCRHFDEILQLENIRQRFRGVSCAGKNGAWCRLRPTSTPACGLDTSSGSFWNRTGKFLGFTQ